MRVRSVAIAMALAWVGCTGLLARLDPVRCGVVPVSSIDLPDDLRLRVRARFAVGDRAIGMELIARATSGELVVIGAAPHGARLFAVQQRGTEYTVDAMGSRELRAVAYWVMDALHRGYWIRAPGRPTDGRASRWKRAGEIVEESWRGASRHREFGDSRSKIDPARSDVDPARVTIDYFEDGTRVEIRNPWCGYEAVLVNLGSRAETVSRLEP